MWRHSIGVGGLGRVTCAAARSCADPQFAMLDNGECEGQSLIYEASIVKGPMTAACRTCLPSITLVRGVIPSLSYMQVVHPDRLWNACRLRNGKSFAHYSNASTLLKSSRANILTSQAEDTKSILTGMCTDSTKQFDNSIMLGRALSRDYSAIQYILRKFNKTSVEFMPRALLACPFALLIHRSVHAANHFARSLTPIVQ